ncbi:MAG: peptidase S8/S53 subtilisin kexin sedolisin [Pseudonocardiales bacterium]|nr:MAG: peptidase S8/S53 subtilisin kexin sedolisin [Pseudonocardiales bacterium]
MRNRKLLLGVVASSTMVLSMAVALASSPSAAAPKTAPAAKSAASAGSDFVVLYKNAGAGAAALADITRAGGRVVSQNTKLGYAVVKSTNPKFASTIDASPAVLGAARNRVIGSVRPMQRAQAQDVERLIAERASLRGSGGQADAPAVAGNAAAVTPEPLANKQWDMRQIGATPAGSYAKNPGKRGVLVGVIDTGVDGTHPDISPNFNAALSRNFTTDMPEIDGPCEHPSCVDPANEDDNGHGTHVASTIGSPINGLGIAGVAPNVTLVNLRAGQDAGFFFLKATLDALTYAGDIGVDVVNMSFFTDPWLFNCLNNPADTPAEQIEQRVIREATQRALNYATHRGVLPVAAEGNEATDLGHPTVDDTSPDFPLDTSRHRVVNNSCITVPTESNGVLVVSATGPTTRKAYYSNWGTEQTDVAAPGGDAYDSPDNTLDVRGLVLAAYPLNVAQADGTLNPDGTPNTPFVVRDCKGTVCAYYQYLQGTSMAAPHAVGVAALIVSHFGKRDRAHGGLGLNASRTRSLLFDTAVPHACPQPRLFHYTRIRTNGTVAEADAFCAGPIQNNGFYGHGIVNAYAAVTG